MKKAVQFTALLAAILMLAGCMKPAGTQTPPAVLTPAPSISPSSGPTEVEPISEEDMAYQEASGEWTYYLKGESSVLYRQKKDGSAAECLNIDAEWFQIADPYLYITTSSDEIYRANMDGTGKKFIGTDMNIFTGGKNLFYTIKNESTLYMADLACEQIEKYPIRLPDEKNPFDEMKKELGYTPSISISPEEREGWIYFYYRLDNASDMTMYGGEYKLDPETGTVEKTDKGEYFDFRQNIGEWTYYLDVPLESQDADSMQANHALHRKNKEGKDENLGVKGFQFDIFHHRIYLDVDMESGGDFMHWETYSYDLEGKGKKKVDCDDMVRSVFNGTLYYHAELDANIYRVDEKTGKTKKYDIKIPDLNKIHEKLDMDSICDVDEISIENVKDGWICFTFYIADLYETVYTGNYRVSLDGKKIEKTDEGTFDPNYLKKADTGTGTIN